MTIIFFYYSIQTIIFRYENNLIESFELPRILNSSKFLNYHIQSHSKGTCLTYIKSNFFEFKLKIKELKERLKVNEL